jgi:Bacterial Ig domain
MSDDIERRLREAFDVQARAAVGDNARPPEPRFAQVDEPTTRSAGRIVRWAAPLTAAAAVVGVVAAVLGLSGSPSGHHGQAAATPSVPHLVPSSTSVRASATTDPNTVRIKLLNDDGATYGTGMPVIAYFSKKITSGAALQRATRATENGKPIAGAWYFEPSDAGKGPIEAHFRAQKPWPAHAHIKVVIPAEGLSAGGALKFYNNLSTHFTTGADNQVTVNGKTDEMTVVSDSKPIGTFPVSLGSTTPTRAGTKVIMEQKKSLTLKHATDNHATIEYAQRLTYGGEYLCAAPWNEQNIKAHVDSTAGSTDLLSAQAKQLYDLLDIGDMVTYTHVAGSTMLLSSGYGDWNVKWAKWLTGGSVPTR